ncbi:hypothetical protein HZ326_18474 [Fusarium oxysporum f. sp. albedinis]|nr:hypothetical protein HZ326_18474 [Fusarium oxysporum f. sp. albedinis]
MTLGINETAMIPPSRALEITPRNAPVKPDCLLRSLIGSYHEMFVTARAPTASTITVTERDADTKISCFTIVTHWALPHSSVPNCAIF